MSAASQPDRDLEAWFRLAHAPGVGRSAARALLAAFGSASAVLAAPPAARRAVVPERVAAALEQVALEQADALQAVQRWLAEDPAHQVITLGDTRYPPALLQTADPPVLLYADGDPTVLARPSIAIVGSRHATPAGLQHARAFAQELAAAGWTVVSGLARGIDAAAHEGALQGQGLTAAVVGTGLDTVYPTAHRALARRIADRGVVISEFAPGTPPLAAHFPQRNRIIAGSCAGVLVVEAALQSGSLITARMAAEAGREVFALPGSIDSPQSRGCHALIKQGAKLVETLEDILDELAPGGAARRPSGDVADRDGTLDREEADEGGAAASDPVLRALGHDPATLDALCARLGWPVPELSARLLELELRGDVARLPGGLYQRTRRG